MEAEDHRFNAIVDLVNENRPKSELIPPIRDEHENELFDRMVTELAAKRRTNPQAMFAHIDSEWGFYYCGYDLD